MLYVHANIYGLDTKHTEGIPRSDSRPRGERVKPDRGVAGGTFDAVEMQRLPIHKAFYEAGSIRSCCQMPAMQMYRI